MKQKVYGFSLIEVALVLAVGGLILIMAFTLLPNLLANEHDSERREDMATFITNLKNYQKNNSRGNLPGKTSGTFASTPTEQSALDNNETLLVSGNAVECDRIRVRHGSNENAIGETCSHPEAQLATSYTDSSWGGFYRDYFTGVFADPEGHNYNFAISNCKKSSTNLNIEQECNSNDYTAFKELGKLSNAFSENDYTIHVLLGAVCDGAIAVRSANARRVAVVYQMERAGVYCYND